MTGTETAATRLTRDTAALVRELESMMPRPLAAMTRTAAYGAGAAALATAGMKKIKEAADASTETLVENRQDTVTSGAEITPGMPS